MPGAGRGGVLCDATMHVSTVWTDALLGAFLTSLPHHWTRLPPTALQRPAHRGAVSADRQGRRAAAAHGPHAVRALEQARADLEAQPMGGAGALAL